MSSIASSARGELDRCPWETFGIGVTCLRPRFLARRPDRRNRDTPGVTKTPARRVTAGTVSHPPIERYLMLKNIPGSDQIPMVAVSYGTRLRVLGSH
jgi:hypothetical protein